MGKVRSSPGLGTESRDETCKPGRSGFKYELPQSCYLGPSSILSEPQFPPLYKRAMFPQEAGSEEAESKDQGGLGLPGEKGVGLRFRLQWLPALQLAELQCEVASLRKEQKVLSGLVESLSTHIRDLTEQQQQLRGQLEDLDSRLGVR